MIRMLIAFLGILVVVFGAFFGSLPAVIIGCLIVVGGLIGRGSPASVASPQAANEEIKYKHTLIPQEPPHDSSRLPMQANVPDLYMRSSDIVESNEPSSEKHRKRVLGS